MALKQSRNKALPAVALFILVSFISGVPMEAAPAADKKRGGILDFTLKSIDGSDVPLSRYKGKVLLLVNVASRCGFTPQYKGLEALYQKYRARGFVILGIPANNFGAQEPGTDAEIKAFCRTNYDVTFDMFSKISVRGEDQHPLYRFLTSEETNPDFAGGVKWNFQKYLIDKTGKVAGKFAPKVEPLSEELTEAVELALKQ